MMLTLAEIKDAVNQLAPQYPIHKVFLFGSYANGEAQTHSDVDVMIAFKPQHAITLLDFLGFQEELAELLAVPVDVVKYPLSATTRQELERGKVVPLYEA